MANLTGIESQLGQARGGTVPPPEDHQHTCPACGYCPHCGRVGRVPQYPFPVYPYPTYPNPWAVFPWTITYCTGSSNQVQ